MNHGNVIISFDNASFAYEEEKPILDEAGFSVRENAKITIMGQNGAGKSTIFKLIMGTSNFTDEETLKPTSGKVHIRGGAAIGIGLQVMPKKYFDFTILEYFESAFSEKMYDLERRIKDVLEVVNLSTPYDKKIKDFSGGQLAR